MKKSLFGLLALVFCAFATLSCDKDKKNEDEEVYLTLPEQQETIAKVVQQVADRIDMTQLQNALSVLSPLKELPFDDILEAASEDVVLGQIIEGMEDENGNVVLDLSRMKYRFKLEFVSSGDGVGEYMAVAPKFTLVSSSHDRFQIDMNYGGGHNVSVWLKGEGSMTTLLEYDDRGENHFISIPKVIRLGLDLDGSGVFGLMADFDTDVKLKRYSSNIAKGELVGDYDEDSGSSYSIECGKFNVAATLNAAQYGLDFALNYVPESGFKLSATLADASAKAELLKIDAGLDGTLQKEMMLDDATIMAWMMNSRSCRKVWADVSVLSGEVAVKTTLDNPFDGIPAQDRVEYMNYLDSDEKMPKAVRNRLIGQISPYFDNGIYFKGYDKAQSKAVIKADGSSSIDVKIVSCVPKSEESMTLTDFLMTDKFNESLSIIVQKVLPIIGMFQSNDK